MSKNYCIAEEKEDEIAVQEEKEALEQHAESLSMKIASAEAHQTKLVEEIVEAGGSLETVSALNQDIEDLKAELINAQARI